MASMFQNGISRIPNVPKGTVFAEQVTYFKSLATLLLGCCCYHSIYSIASWPFVYQQTERRDIETCGVCM